MAYNINWSKDQTFGQFFGSVGQSVGYWELALVFEFFLIVLVGSTLNKRNVGYTNLLTWIEVASVVVLLSSVFLSLGGYIATYTVLICLALTITFVLIDVFAGNLFKDNSSI